MGLVLGLSISLSGVVAAAIAFSNRDKPEWERDLRAVLVLAVGQVALGTVSTALLR